jgi:Contractile injection system tube protein
VERVAFLVDATGERIDCLLNPETLEVRRLAGVRSRSSAGGQLVGAGLADDPLLFTGGGRTELVLDLLFDADLVESAVAPRDVRALTGPLWRLAENSAQERGSVRPPLVRLVWGKSWNVPGVIVAVAERFDAFDATGTPRRSWLRLKLVRVAEPAAAARATFEEELTAMASAPAVPATGAVQVIGDGSRAGDARSGDHGAGTQRGGAGMQRGGAGMQRGGLSRRFDLVAAQALGNPLRWRLLAEHNGIADPLGVPGGTVLGVPAATTGGTA